MKTDTHSAKILMTEFVTHDVKRFIVSKPEDFSWVPGQGINLIIDQPKWRNKRDHPFTPTGLVTDLVISFTIKRYAEDKSVSDKLHSLTPGEKILISNAFGNISYKGPGVFIAAGSGITPFLAIFRQLAVDDKLDGHQLIYSNKTPADVICEKELHHLLSEKCLLTYTRAKTFDHHNGRIDKTYLSKNIRSFNQYFYICGPKFFVMDVKDILVSLGASSDHLIFEKSVTDVFKREAREANL